MGWAPPSVEAALKGARAAEDQARASPPPRPPSPSRSRPPSRPPRLPRRSRRRRLPRPTRLQAAKKFGGAKAGYVFKKGAQGVGYYADVKPTPAIGKKGAPRRRARRARRQQAATRKLPNGVELTDLVVGRGAQADRGRKVNVKYVGTLTTGKRFDAGKIGFRLGAGEVIKGWDTGVAGMKVGGKRTLRIPPQLAYGKRGAPPTIPPNATLLFDVELLGC